MALGSGIQWRDVGTSTEENEDVWIPTVCLNCGPSVQCPLLVHRVNGIVTRIKGNPEAPSNLGRICAKSQAMLSELYNPYRVRFPVKRTNPNKGANVDPGWVEISWEEALNTVASQVGAVIKDDPRKLVLMSGHVGPNLLRYFAASCGTPNSVSGGTATFCGGATSAVNSWVYGEQVTYPDMPRSRYVISFGATSIQVQKAPRPNCMTLWQVWIMACR